MAVSVVVSPEALTEFCRRRRIRRLALFGSVLREDFGPDSDVDVLVEYEPDARHDLWDHHAMCEELRAIFGRRVDLINKEALERSENPFRRRAILESAETVYVAR
ncbi:nucleotidyltransferase domain-containing protein [Candidatus Sumerlaeota bacterium]|nr:nucleotidyltransferase domain-containing protein [Candidatus Sumerlaeota bacterium]